MLFEVNLLQNAIAIATTIIFMKNRPIIMNISMLLLTTKLEIL